MPPAKPRLNTTTAGVRSGAVAGARLNQSKRRLVQHSFLGSSAKNKSFVLGGKIVKRRSSSIIRKNNIALAKALNASKQKTTELTALVMRYRKRANAAERQVQQFQNFKQDLQSLLEQYSEPNVQDESDDFSQEHISQLCRVENERLSKGAQYHKGFKEARTQLVNPMVQGMSINKVKVRLERINDVPCAGGRPSQESVTGPGEVLHVSAASGQRGSLQDVDLSNSTSVSAEASLREEPHSPVDQDITVDLTMVQQLGTSVESFTRSLRVPSLTLQRLSLQDIQRTTSAAYVTETHVKMSSSDQSSHDQSGSVQLGRSMFPAEGDRISFRQSAHEALDGQCNTAQNVESPKETDTRQRFSLDNPLEGTSWMHDTNRLPRSIRVRSCRSMHQKLQKREAAKRRYSIKNLAAKDGCGHSACEELTSPTSDKVALQDMSLTLCLPMQADNPQILPQTAKPAPAEPQGDVESDVIQASRGGRASIDLSISLGRRSPTVAVTRLFEEDIFRLSAVGSNSFTSDASWTPVVRQEVVSPPVAVTPGDEPSHTDSSVGQLPATVATNIQEQHTVGLATDGDVSACDVAQISPGSLKVVLNRVDDETDAVEQAPKRRTWKSKKSKVVPAPVLRRPSRQVKKTSPGTYKEQSLGRKLRR